MPTGSCYAINCPDIAIQDWRLTVIMAASLMIYKCQEDRVALFYSKCQFTSAKPDDGFKRLFTCSLFEVQYRFNSG